MCEQSETNDFNMFELIHDYFDNIEIKISDISMSNASLVNEKATLLGLIEQLQSEIVQKDKNFELLRAENVQLRSEIVQKDKDFEDIEKKLSDSSLRNTILVNANAYILAPIDDLRAEILQKDEMIQHLQTENKDYSILAGKKMLYSFNNAKRCIKLELESEDFSSDEDLISSDDDLIKTDIISSDISDFSPNTPSTPSIPSPSIPSPAQVLIQPDPKHSDVPPEFVKLVINGKGDLVKIDARNFDPSKRHGEITMGRVEFNLQTLREYIRENQLDVENLIRFAKSMEQNKKARDPNTHRANNRAILTQIIREDYGYTNSVNKTRFVPIA